MEQREGVVGMNGQTGALGRGFPSFGAQFHAVDGGLTFDLAGSVVRAAGLTAADFGLDGGGALVQQR